MPAQNNIEQKNLVHPNEKILGRILMTFGALIWIGVILGTEGVDLIFLGIGFFFYVVALSGFISHLKGNGAIITEDQFPDLYRALKESAEALNITTIPTMVLMHADGLFNAFAWVFRGGLMSFIMICLIMVVGAGMSVEKTFVHGYETNTFSENPEITDDVEDDAGSALPTD